MTRIRTMLSADIDPSNPIPELSHVIAAVISHNPGHEEAILTGLQESITRALIAKKGAEKVGKPVLQSDTEQKDQ